MKLIKKLGTKKDKGYVESRGLFECPECGKLKEKRLDNGIKAKTCGYDCACACRPPKKVIHGDSTRNNEARLYRTWTSIKKRCYNKNNDHYEHYGGRGIAVCKEWCLPRLGYINFREWALANGYEDHLTIDRIDNDGNYCPENCQWITLSENIAKRNRSHSKRQERLVCQNV